MSRTTFDPPTIVPPERWGRDHWTVLAYAFTQAGRILKRDRMRVNAPEYPTRLQGGDELSGHDDLDCLRDAQAAGVLRNAGTGAHPLPTFTPQGAMLEIAEVLPLLPAWASLLLRLQWATGARLGELASLRIGDLDARSNTLRPPRSGPRPSLRARWSSRSTRPSRSGRRREPLALGSSHDAPR